MIQVVLAQPHSAMSAMLYSLLAKNLDAPARLAYTSIRPLATSTQIFSQGCPYHEECTSGRRPDGSGTSRRRTGRRVDQSWRTRVLWSDQHRKRPATPAHLPPAGGDCAGTAVRCPAHLPARATRASRALAPLLCPLQRLRPSGLFRARRLVSQPICAVLPRAAWPPPRISRA